MKHILRFLVLAVLVVTPSYALAAPAIRDITGPSTLTVGQEGTWSFQVISSAPAGSAITYDVDSYGDGTRSNSAQTLPNFKHTYTQAGQYVIKFRATDSTGSGRLEMPVTVSSAPASISNVTISNNQATWISGETAPKQISWTYSGIPTGQNLQFRYGAWNTVDNKWINQAYVAIPQASGTGRGSQTANVPDLTNLGKTAVVKVVLVNRARTPHSINGVAVEARSAETFVIRKKGTASFAVENSTFTTQTESFKGQNNVQTAKVDLVLAVTATGGYVYINPTSADISIKNGSRLVSLASGDIVRYGTVRVNGADSTNPAATAQFANLIGSEHIFKVEAGKTEKFHITMTFRKDKLASGTYSAVLNSVKIGDLDAINLSPRNIARNLAGSLTIASNPALSAVTPSVVKGVPVSVDGVDLRGRAITIVGVTAPVTATYVDIAGGVRAKVPTTNLVPGKYTLKIAGISAEGSFTVTGPTQTAPSVPKITSVVVGDFPLIWTNGVAAYPVTVTYEGLPRGKNILLYFKSDLNGETIDLPSANSRKDVGSSGGFTVNIAPGITNNNLLNKEYYVVAKVMNGDRTEFRVGGARVEARSANRFQIVPRSTASAEADSQLANTETASRSLWDKFVDWLI